MALYPTYTRFDIAAVTGRDESEIGVFGEEAIIQAILLFKLGTCLAQFPDDAQQAQVARYAILFMADAIESVQKYQKVLRSPFNSETIGSYSYSKLTSAVSAGLPTGVSWFDIGIGELSVCDHILGIPFSGGYNVYEENKHAHGGYGVYRGPAEQFPDSWGPDTVHPEVG